jgi:hypothetical protein
MELTIKSISTIKPTNSAPKPTKNVPIINE